MKSQPSMFITLADLVSKMASCFVVPLAFAKYLSHLTVIQNFSKIPEYCLSAFWCYMLVLVGLLTLLHISTVYQRLRTVFFRAKSRESARQGRLAQYNPLELNDNPQSVPTESRPNQTYFTHQHSHNPTTYDSSPYMDLLVELANIIRAFDEDEIDYALCGGLALAV